MEVSSIITVYNESVARNILWVTTVHSKVQKSTEETKIETLEQFEDSDTYN